MTPDRASYYIDVEGSNEEAVRLAFAWLQQAAQSHAQAPVALLVVPIKDTLKRSFAATVLTEAQVRALQKGQRIAIVGGELELATERKMPYSASGPVLALYPTQKILDGIDDMHGVTEVLVVPWLRRHVEAWVNTWQAEEITGKGRGQPPSLHPMLVEALDTLASLVNVSTPNTSDERMAVEVFTLLRGEGVPYDPTEVRAWLMSKHGFPPRSADIMTKKAAAVQQGRRIRRHRERYLAEDIVEQWRARA